MTSYSLVSQEWIATSPLISSDTDTRPFELLTNEQVRLDETHEVTSRHPLQHIRSFCTVTANRIEANRIRARLTRTEVADHIGMTLSALNDIIAARKVITPLAAARLKNLLKRDIQLYPVIPSQTTNAVRTTQKQTN
jgi:plasmid maintenance system antidote protein VapI